MASIRDVAKAAGVSTATVSNVLNGRLERVSVETREKVLSAVRALKYRPTPLEKDQKAILSQNIGLMVPDLTMGPVERHGYFRNILDGALEAAAFRGWSVTIFVERMWNDVGLAVRRSYDGRCDGLISVAPQPGNDVVEALQARGTPLVLVGTTPWLSNVSSVDVDNFAAGDLGAKHLIELKHRRLAFMNLPREQVSSVERREAFVRTAIQSGLDPADVHVITCEGPDIETTCASGWNQLKKIERRPTAIMGWHDGLAAQLVSRAAQSGIRVPEDVSVMGVDDSLEALECSPQLTTLTNPLHVIGRRAATMLIDRLVGGMDAAEIVRFAPELVVRQSTVPFTA